MSSSVAAKNSRVKTQAHIVATKHFEVLRILQLYSAMSTSANLVAHTLVTWIVIVDTWPHRVIGP